MGPHPRTETLEALADTLWSERHVVEYLLFKLVTAKLVLASDERRFVGASLDEVDRVLDGLRQAEKRRAGALEAVAREWQMLPHTVTLSLLAREAPPPMDEVFRDHHEAFQRLTTEIEETAALNRRLASAALGEVRHSLEELTGRPGNPMYDAFGRPGISVGARPTRLDEAL